MKIEKYRSATSFVETRSYIVILSEAITISRNCEMHVFLHEQAGFTACISLPFTSRHRDTEAFACPGCRERCSHVLVCTSELCSPAPRVVRGP